MKILIDIGDPAHVHFFRNFIREMEERGHQIRITARDTEIIRNLLNAYGIEYSLRGAGSTNLLGKAFNIMEIDYKIYRAAKKFKPDILAGIHNPYIAQVGKLIGKPSITFTDTECAYLADYLTFPFTDVILTPSCFSRNLGENHVRYNGYHELAYLHPNYFKPNPDILEELNLSKGERFFVLRFVAWQAHHDVTHKGLCIGTKRKLVRELEEQGRVLISSERPLEREFKQYELKISPERIHDLLYFATMYIGEGATIASEAALLGTPSIYVNPLSRGYISEESEKYGLVYYFTNQEEALKKAKELLTIKNLKKEWKKKRDRLLKEKIDVTKFMTEFIVNHSNSFKA